MANRCEICGKGPQTGSSISHSHIRSKRRWLPNLQKVRASVSGRPVTMSVCTKCLKAGKVTRSA
jgi:large subunit ribosomal protein L28